jgi:hypothetical protein
MLVWKWGRSNMAVVLYFCLGMIMYTIGYFVGRANGKAETPTVKVEPKLLSVPAKAVVLKRASEISHAEKMSAPYEVVLKEHVEDLRDALVEDAKRYVRFETGSFEDSDTVTATLAIYDINEENK